MNKIVRVELPFLTKKDEGLIVGYASKAIPDDVNHLIPAEVWLSGIQRYFREGMPVKLLHRPGLTVGETVWLKVVEDGLILASRPTVPEIWGLVEKGLLTAYSVGFLPKGWVDREDGIREFTDLELVEVSYVDQPMNPGTYFEVIPKMLEGHEIVFDAKTGTVTVYGLKPEEMAQLSALLQGALVKAGLGPVSNVQKIEFKAASPETEAAPAGEAKETESSMSLLKQIWDFLRGTKAKEETVENRSEPMTEEMPTVKSEETATPAVEKAAIVELEAKFAQLSEQLKAHEAALAEVKTAVDKLAQILDSFIPSPNSTPVLDTSQGRPVEQKYKWGFFGPIQ